MKRISFPETTCGCSDKAAAFCACESRSKNWAALPKALFGTACSNGMEGAACKDVASGVTSVAASGDGTLSFSIEGLSSEAAGTAGSAAIAALSAAGTAVTEGSAGLLCNGLWLAELSSG